MVNIRFISSILIKLQTNDAILARIEFMVFLNSIVLLLLFSLDIYRRRYRSQPIKYILLVLDASSTSILIHTIGLMQNAPLRNSIFEVWAILLVVLRYSSSYITVYGLQPQVRVQWNMELARALLSFIWAARLNSTRASDYKFPLWTLWALQPLRICYMFLAYNLAVKSYWQQLSSVLVADYMKTEHESTDPEAGSNKNELENNSKSKPKEINPNAQSGFSPSIQRSVSNQQDSCAPHKVEDTEPKTIHMVDAVNINDTRTNKRRASEIEKIGEKNKYGEPSSCNSYAEPQQSIQGVNVGTNVENSGNNPDFDPSSMKGYRYLIQGETRHDVEPKLLEGKLQLRITHKVITLEKIWQCEGKLLREWGDKDGKLKYLCLSFALYRLLRCRFDKYPLPADSVPKTRTLLLDGIIFITRNGQSTKEDYKKREDLEVDFKDGNMGAKDQQGKSKEGSSDISKQGSDNDRHELAEELDRDIKQPITHTIDQNKIPGGPDSTSKQLDGLTKKKKLSEREQYRITEVQTFGEKQQDGHVHSQNRSTEKHDKDGSNAEDDEDKLYGEIAERVFMITGAELSFLNDYMYSRFPIIFWRAEGLIISILFSIMVIATTVWVGISVIPEYTPQKYEITHKVLGHNLDLLITWIILFFIVAKETWETIIYLFSDWTKVVLISMYVKHACMRNWLIDNLVWLFCKLSVVGRWHGKIGQYNFLQAYNYKPPVCNSAYYLSFGSLPKATDGVNSKGQFLLSKEVQKAIVESICSLKEEIKLGSLPGGILFILNRNNLSEEVFQIRKLHEQHTCSHIILVWHIATSLCEIELCRNYNVYLSDSELPSLWSLLWSSLNCCRSEHFLVKDERLDRDLRRNFTVANSLSQYCAHLLIEKPDLLPDEFFVPEVVFKSTVREARDVLEGCHTLQTIYKRLMKEGGKGIEHKNEKTIMRLSAWLGKMLIENFDEAARWKALAGVWADLLVYMAPNSNVAAHKECLATGGEFITHVWILLYHAGIVKNSLLHNEKESAETEAEDNAPRARLQALRDSRPKEKGIIIGSPLKLPVESVVPEGKGKAKVTDNKSGKGKDTGHSLQQALINSNYCKIGSTSAMVPLQGDPESIPPPPVVLPSIPPSQPSLGMPQPLLENSHNVRVPSPSSLMVAQSSSDKVTENELGLLGDASDAVTVSDEAKDSTVSVQSVVEDEDLSALYETVVERKGDLKIGPEAEGKEKAQQ